MVIFGATGPVDAHKRRPWIDWIHTAADQGAIIRNYIKWDDQPASPQAAVESGAAGQPDRPHRPLRAGLRLPRRGSAGSSRCRRMCASRTRRGMRRRSLRSHPPPCVKQAREVLKKAKFPVILMGRMSRSQADWDRRVKLAEALSAPVLTSSNDPSSFPTTHPLHLGRARHCVRRRQAVALVKKADVLSSVSTGWTWPGICAAAWGHRRLRRRPTRPSSTAPWTPIAPTAGAWTTRRCPPRTSRWRHARTPSWNRCWRVSAANGPPPRG